MHLKFHEIFGLGKNNERTCLQSTDKIPCPRTETCFVCLIRQTGETETNAAAGDKTDF